MYHAYTGVLLTSKFRSRSTADKCHGVSSEVSNAVRLSKCDFLSAIHSNYNGHLLYHFREKDQESHSLNIPRAFCVHVRGITVGIQ